MAIQNKYKGKSYSGSRSGNTYEEVWWGTKAECDDFVAALRMGSTDFSGGFILDSYKLKQDTGPIWDVTLTYANTVDSTGAVILDPAGPTSHDLDVKMTDFPLETCKLYHTQWNYHLAGLEGEDTPGWWSTTKVLKMSLEDAAKYRWVKNISDVYGLKPVNGKKWVILGDRTLPGVEARQLPTYTIREWSFHADEAKAAWAVINKAGQIGTPRLGDFGVVKYNSGNWRFDGGQVTPEGKKFKAFVTWRHAPGDGWKVWLYGPTAF